MPAPSARSSAALILCVGLSAPAAAGPVLPGVEVRQVKPPPVLFEGVRSVEVPMISGAPGAIVHKELLAALADPAREVGSGTVSDKAGALLEVGASVGGQLLASKVPGLGGKLVKGATEAAGAAVADKVRAEKIVLQDGLKIDVFAVKPSGAEAKLKIALKTSSADKNTTQQVALKDDKGNDVKDEKGNTVMVDEPCLERVAKIDLEWTLERKGAPLSGSLPTATAGDRRCGKDMGKITKVDELTLLAAPGLGGSLARQIAPSWTSLRLPMRRSPLSRAPLERVAAGEVEAARCMFLRLGELETGAAGVDPDVWVNLGAASEGLGFLPEAEAAYAGALQRKPGLNAAEEGRGRVTARRAEITAMERAYGLKYAIGAAPACPALPEGTAALVKKGGPLLASGGGAPTGVEVEKGELVFVRSRAGAFAEISTLDGKAGALPIKSVP